MRRNRREDPPQVAAFVRQTCSAYLASFGFWLLTSGFCSFHVPLDVPRHAVLASLTIPDEEGHMRRFWRSPTCVRKAIGPGLVALGLALGVCGSAQAQSNTRLLLASGWGVPGHPGFAYGPFSGLAMSEGREIVFLSSLRGAKSELRAVVRSSGVTFSVVAFEGLRAPVPKTTYESFGAPSLNDSGVIAFSATLKDDVPTSAVIRVEGDNALAIATSGNPVPGNVDATFQEFSPPAINSAGNVLFGARLAGKQPGTGLFFWTPRGLQILTLPPELHLTPSDLLTPAFSSHDEAVFVRRGTPLEAVTDQFFRAVALKNFQDLRPQPEPAEVVEVLPARPGDAPVTMLLVLMEGENVQTAELRGDPSQPVTAKRSPGGTLLPFGHVHGQATGPRGNIILAAAPAAQENDLALYCYCEGQVIRLTSPEEFLPITQFSSGRRISSLASDGQNTTAFIAPNDASADSVAIYVIAVP